MVVKASKLYGMDVYTDGGKYLGKVYDLIIDLEKGDVVRITMEPLKAASKDEAKKVLRERSVLYKNVKSVEDIIVVTQVTSSAPLPLEEEEEEEKPARNVPSFMRAR
jgi:sporulation protein YlmC with PRC-barrel domain